ncbi:MAG: hypothetical protein KatS3mg111_0681 [Pirellulaceae bacterium]|nr:MAG: hypothetical protein KatS3mg111_0681 [Pirellulaceae bacterium]
MACSLVALGGTHFLQAEDDRLEGTESCQFAV